MIINNEIKDKAEAVVHDFNSYEAIKDRLIIRPLYRESARFNEHFRKTPFVFRNFGKDAALAVYVIISDDDNALYTTALLYEVLAQWNMDEDKVFEQAMMNTANRTPARLYKSLFETDETLGIDPTKPDYTSRLKKDITPMVTTTRQTNGAIAMMFPNVKEGIAEMFGDSFYVSFTSIHEALLHKRGVIDPTSIKRSLVETNRIFGPSDTFTNGVWYYDKENKTFTEVA